MNNNPSPAAIKKKEFRLVGLKLPKKTTNKANQSSKDCGELWQKFEKEQLINRIEGRLSDEIYAVYFDYEKDETETFSYFIGCKVAKDAKTADNLQELMIPPQEYTVYTAKGVMTGCISDTWHEIRNSSINRQFGFDFEIYGERSRNWNDAEVDIYLSVLRNSL